MDFKTRRKHLSKLLCNTASHRYSVLKELVASLEQFISHYIMRCNFKI